MGQLQALLAQVRAGGAATLGELLTHRGLLSPAELAALMSRLQAAQRSPSGRFNLPEHRPGDPEQLGDYRILKRLGAGGMGAVYLAEHVKAGVRYALKTTLARPLGHRRQRFKREGEAQAKSGAHPNVVSVHVADEQDGQLYLVMDLCEGGDLEARLESGLLEPEETMRMVGDLARGRRIATCAAGSTRSGASGTPSPRKRRPRTS